MTKWPGLRIRAWRGGGERRHYLIRRADGAGRRLPQVLPPATGCPLPWGAGGVNVKGIIFPAACCGFSK